ncbi:RDD domain containing protein [Segniliparus rotundus DSM 44985]|uniref:RDD domain containing protein n=1 Tax=Segniliparus rotundus (strain ATCC BAA-972 / CDC 1076 / CIP 108378 / DSM 44985 / JCM 13578) TaxID=640132 RepID=D6ZE15_SEGRD|nr:RDD family protein [Segniliparus rotundus]ADG97295.1 RDD domain containing protein [Segniliparus rotundus DSM 44985]
MPLVFPEAGVGSLAPLTQRALALFIDWVLSGGVALLFTDFTSNSYSTAVLAVWAAMGAVAVSLFSFTPGQLFVGLRVIRVPDSRGNGGDQPVGALRAAGRAALLALVIPAFLVDKNGRGFQDRLTNTAVVRLR